MFRRGSPKEGARPVPSGSHAPSSGSHALESEEECLSSRSDSPRIPSLAPVIYKRTRGGHNERANWQQLSQHVIKELMKALKEYGHSSPYFLGLLNGQLTRSVVVPHDLNYLFRCLHSKTEYQLWEATWKALLSDALPSLLEAPETAVDNEGNLITLKHLMGEGSWESPQKQAEGIPSEVLGAVAKLAEKAFITMRPSGPLQSYLDVFQGPNEHYLHFVERLTAAVEQQEEDEVARGRLLQSLAFKHANEICKRAILTLPRDPRPTLQDFVKVVTEANRCDPDLPFRFIILGELPHLHGMIFQWDKRVTTLPRKDRGRRDPLLIIEWVFLSHQRSKRMTCPQELMADLIRKARIRIRELAGCDFECIHVPIKVKSGQITKAMLEHLLQENEALQFALDSYTGQIFVHRPAHKIFNSDAQFRLALKSVQSNKPLEALTIFTDASGGSHKSVVTWKDPQTQRWESDRAEVEGSPQVAELAAVVRAFERFSEPFNLVTDSAYVAGVVSRAENSILQEVSNIALYKLLSKLVKLISHRKQPFYVVHTRSHTDLPGFIAEGNRRADALAAPAAIAPLPDIYQQAKISHQLFHQNVPGLVRQFHLTRDQAKAIVATCPSCQRHAVPTMHAGVNPRGLRSNEIWQMDVTHFSQFGKLKYVHVSVDTFSGAVFASAHTGEKSVDVKKHLLQAFSFMGIPKLIKTDNGPGYASKEFCTFLQQWGVEHRTGIPYSSTGQAIVERTHQNIKRVLAQQDKIHKLDTPQIRLARALFTLNFLNCSFESMNPPIIRHFGGDPNFKVKERPPVLVKDPETLRTEGPLDLITWGRGYTCVSAPDGVKWVPAKWVRPYVPKASSKGNKLAGEVSWRRKKKLVVQSARRNPNLSSQFLSGSIFNPFCLFSSSSRSQPTRPAFRAPVAECRLLQLVMCFGFLAGTVGWIVPQPKANVWRTLAMAMGQDHICLSQGSAQNPISSCLMGIPLKEDEFPPALLNFKAEYNKQTPSRHTRARLLEEFRLQRKIKLPVINPLILWRDWVSTSLPRSDSEPQELELLGSSPAPFCVQFVFTPPPGQENLFTRVLQIKDAYLANPWCENIAHVKMASTPGILPLSLPKGVFLICGDWAFTGIPSRLVGGPCTLGKLSLLAPNKTTIMDWIVQNSSSHSTVQKRDLTNLDPDCESEIIHWSRAKATAITVFLPWVSVAKAMGELGRLECWVAKQANVISNALAGLLQDEDVTRQATLQNRVAIDYLLLLHHHTCEEFEGLCCFNLSSRAEDVQQSIRKLRDMVQDIKKESKDWWDNLFGNWGLSGWLNSIVKTGALILFILLFGITCGVILRFTSRMITNATSALSVNSVWATAPPAEEMELQDFPPADIAIDSMDPENYVPDFEGHWPPKYEEWMTKQPWFAECYPESDFLPPPLQYASF
ncbi:hypothetical protein HGM15179_015617 [Zosterops borbonicus]|uniref:RNA-directed DNA polymerase n=1 Tax=Zosterops borbonicus TaxID=364589 RepID=A0A8K1G4H7_9PASS|nr:hypothetical protein HGM15179_015617 [Zosterops borbonicus]